MVDKKIFWGMCAAMSISIAIGPGGHCESTKKAEGDDFTEKLEKRFPEEAKRGKKSIFRTVSSEDDDSSETPATKKSETKEKSDEKEEVKEKAVKKEEKSEKVEKADQPSDESEKPQTGGLAGFFKKLKGNSVVNSPSDDKEEEESTTEAPVVAKPIEPDAMKKEKADKSKSAETPEELADEPKVDNRVSNPGFFSKFKEKMTEDETEIPLLNEKAPEIKLPDVQTSKDGIKQFASWDDVPYKKQDPVQRMMDKLVVKTPAKPNPSGAPLPRALPGGPSVKSASAPAEEKSE